MPKENRPQKPTNLRPYDYRIRINWQRFTKLEISPYYEKHNTEYLNALRKKKTKLTAKQLASKSITDDLIRKILVPQLNGEEVDEDEIDEDSAAWATNHASSSGGNRHKWRFAADGVDSPPS